MFMNLNNTTKEFLKFFCIFLHIKYPNVRFVRSLKIIDSKWDVVNVCLTLT